MKNAGQRDAAEVSGRFATLDQKEGRQGWEKTIELLHLWHSKVFSA